MPKVVRMPISNVLMGSNFTGTIMIGDRGVKANMILDTGSSALAVAGHVYNPTKDANAQTTKLAQEVRYGSGTWIGAVVQTSVAVSRDVSLTGVNLAVTYHDAQNIFGSADGIFGLAYRSLDNAFSMPADTWATKYDASEIVSGNKTDVDPCFAQFEEAGIVANIFAFYTRRSILSAATSKPETDPLNQGVFVIGGGRECRDLYTGAFTSVAVLNDQWYDTNLLAVQVGDQSPIRVPQLPPGSSRKSNSLVDSGSTSLVLTENTYNEVIKAFGRINADFAKALTQFSIRAKRGTDQKHLHLDAWPNLLLTMQGADGSQAVLTITPDNYWQFDAMEKGMAVANMHGDGGSLGGRSILGMPLFSGYFTVFDRSAANGLGVIEFASRT